MEGDQRNARPTGLDCPACGCMDSRVIYTRHHKFTLNGQPQTKTVRRRQCRNCGRCFRSTEKTG